MPHVIPDSDESIHYRAFVLGLHGHVSGIDLVYFVLAVT